VVPVLPIVPFEVPAGFERLVEMAYDLWWSWSPEGRDLWASLDPVEWERTHNPVHLLASIEPTRWEQIRNSEVVLDRYHAALDAYDWYHNRETWFDRAPNKPSGPIAYLCTEYGVHDTLPIYSGGLGILAGDHAKSASDMGIPLVAVGLLYRRGYFRQEIDLDGEQQHFYPVLDPRQLPLLPVASPTGGQLRVGIEFPGRTVHATVWRLQVGRVPVLLLDTDIPENHPADRPITHQLYVAGREMRFCQELVLGVGAVRALAALGIEPAVWHVNEGHAAMSVLERAARLVEAGETLENARERIRNQTVFTLHTPVPAGNEVFERGLAAKYLGPWAARMKADLEELLGLASDGAGDRFDLGALAIRFARVTNGVSRRHGEVVTADWQHLIGGPAQAVTNGIHTPTWVGREAGALLVRKVGRSWPTRLLENPDLVEEARSLPDSQIWSMHRRRKELFLTYARERIRTQLARLGAAPDELRAVDQLLPADRLTLGFARRFATYKRATLMFSDTARLESILTDPQRPVQIVIAGKAHPADRHGQEFVRRIAELAASPSLRGYVVMLEDYDARMARYMTQGVDVWVNNPRPPLEASGTSGMKAAINGTLNLSVLDGWWVEGFNGKNGWVFGSAEPNGDWEQADAADAAAFYDVLEREVVPLYYDRDPDGVPVGWTERMKESIVSTLVRFSAHRMLKDYWEMAYLPLGTGLFDN
jgi:starch phosphorylase